MNRLTPIFIAGAIAVAAGLAFAQSQIEPDQEGEGGHGGHSMSTTGTNSSWLATDKVANHGMRVVTR